MADDPTKKSLFSADYQRERDAWLSGSQEFALQHWTSEANLRAARMQLEAANKIAEAHEAAREKRARPGQKLLGETEIAQGQLYYESLLNANLKRWCSQQAAAKHIAVAFYRLPEESWQTIEDAVVIPVLDKRGLRKRTNKAKK
jgi:hypothetical protein